MLHQHIDLLKTRRVQKDGFFLRAESFFNWATVMDVAEANRGYGPSPLNAYGGKSLHEQSHGESFLAMIDNRLRPPGLYIFDEPESALSPQRQLTFLHRLHGLVQKGGQFVIATHSPIILGYPDAWIYEVSDQGVQRAEYEELEHYRITKSFLNRRETFLNTLLADDS